MGSRVLDMDIITNALKSCYSCGKGIEFIFRKLFHYFKLEYLTLL
jgi:hypothetical protein